MADAGDRSGEHEWLVKMVGEGRFELPTACSQSRCATELRHSPLTTHEAGHRSAARARPSGARPTAGRHSRLPAGDPLHCPLRCAAPSSPSRGTRSSSPSRSTPRSSTRPWTRPSASSRARSTSAASGAGRCPAACSRRTSAARASPASRRCRTACPTTTPRRCAPTRSTSSPRPEIDITSGGDEGPVAFDAVVEIRPTVVVEGYDHLEVTVPRPFATDEDIDERIDRMRAQYADFEAADRPAVDGDQVLIDIAGDAGRRGDRGARRRRLPLRGRLRRGRARDRREPARGQGRRHPRLRRRAPRGGRGRPPLPGAGQGGPGLGEARADRRVGGREHRPVDRRGAAGRTSRSSSTGPGWCGANMAMQQRTAEALAALVDRRPARAARRQRGLGPHPELRSPPPPAEPRPRPLPAADRHQRRTTWSPSTASRPSRPSRSTSRCGPWPRRKASRSSDEDLDKHFAELARQYGVAADEIRHNFEHAGQMLAVRSEIRKGKALDWVLERVSVVDEDGNSGRTARHSRSPQTPSRRPLPPATRHQPPTNRPPRRGRMESDQDRPGRPPGRAGRDAAVTTCRS